MSNSNHLQAPKQETANLNERYPLSLREKVDNVPMLPGCYLMKSSGGQVIYVGKAKVLRNRVRQYFQNSTDLTRRVRRMVYEIEDLEWIATDSELEALILESNLIKRHHPIYNVRMRDDKSYPYIGITFSEEWPRPVFMRKLRMHRAENDRFFGPYTDSVAVRDTLRLIRKIFQVPCGYKDPEASKGKACMYYHIGQCKGACVGKVSKGEYLASIQDVMDFLEGRSEHLVQKLLAQMESAADALEFEKAARIRDEVQAIQTLIARQKIISTTLDDQDVAAMVADNSEACVQMFFVRGGKLVGQEHFLVENAEPDDLAHSLEEFLLQYYENAAYIPQRVLVSADIEGMDILENWLRTKRGSKVEVLNPKRGEKHKLVEMARKNAEIILRQLVIKMEADQATIEDELATLQKAISAPKLPSRIEAYDISNIQGYHTVASLVVFENGRPFKNHYRRFKISQPDGKPDDYASMREVLSRRLTGSLRKTAAFEDLPDLMIIDGGKGQLNVALELIVESGENVQVIGLAKQNEEIYVPGRSTPILLPRTSHALRLIQRVRDEAHRFAVAYHRILRGKTVRTSVLSEIPSIGAKRMNILIKRFGSVDKIRLASEDELASAPGMTRSAAQQVKHYFQSSDEARG